MASISPEIFIRSKKRINSCSDIPSMKSHLRFGSSVDIAKAQSIIVVVSRFRQLTQRIPLIWRIQDSRTWQ
jgi:hypothetical protein